MSAWQEAMQDIRTNVFDITLTEQQSSTLSSGGISITVPSRQPDSWVSPPPCALAVAEANLKAMQSIGSTKKMPVPLSGASVTKHSASLRKVRLESKRAREAMMVRELF
jgi:flagellar hook-length control protein FliK